MNPWLRLLGKAFEFVVLLASRPRLAIYFIVIVLGVGGVGVWIPLFQLKCGGQITLMDVYHSFATYAIAIAVTAFAEFLLRNKDELTLMMFAFGLTLVGSVPAVVILVHDSTSMAATCTKISIFATLWLWFIALADSPAFDEGDARTTLGD